MEHVIAGAKFPAKCVKNEIHNLLTTLRLTRHNSSQGPQAQFHYEALRSFQCLFEELTYIHELHDFDTVAYLGPFLEVIQSDATDGQITAVALGAVDKFVSFGLISPESPRCMEAMNTLAWGVINCRFVSSGSNKDEVVLLKMVGLLIDCLRCPAGDYLSDMCVWNMVRKCFQISRQPRASHLLRSSAEGMLQQMILTVFGTHKERARRIRVKGGSAPTTGVSGAGGGCTPASDTSSQLQQPLQVYKPYGYRAMHFVLRFLAFLLAYGRSTPGAACETKRQRIRRPRSRSPRGGMKEEQPSPLRRSDSRDRSPSGEAAPTDLGLSYTSATVKDDLCIDMHCLGLSLLNVALESGGGEIARSDELIAVIQDDICKSLLQNSRTDSLSVLSLTLRAIFNLFLHFRRHLKVHLEIFLSSVHLKIAGLSSVSYEQRELALESLLEFCREPELMLELYENYDCDVRCTNLFETLVRFLVTNAFPPDGVHGVRGGFNSLHRLAFSGLLSVLHSIALRCVSHAGRQTSRIPLTAGPQPSLETTPDGGETELQRKKEQKRRLGLAARTFNADPSKSMGALQSLGVVASPPTPESMAEFLRHTPGLDLPLVGEYLAKRKDFNGMVRKAFMTLFCFQCLGLVEALRAVLSTFRLPGESQLIERLMESFAEEYYVAQPLAMDVADVSTETDMRKVPRYVPREKTNDEGSEEDALIARSGCPDAGGGPEADANGEAELRVKMANSDTIFVLSYSIIMLNTDLHNHGVKKKMTIPEFLRNNRSIDGGSDLPEFFLRDIYCAIRDEEIRLHGDPVSAEGEQAVVDDFFWEGIMRRSESIDEFSATERLLSETPPGNTEREMFLVIMESAPLPTLSLCYESVPDVSVASQAMMGFQDLAKISYYYEQVDTVNSLARVMCQSFCRATAAGEVSIRAQIALRAAQQCVSQHASFFREAEWRAVLDVILQLWALDLLPPHLTEFDDFSGPDGKPLGSLCDLKPPFPAPIARPTAHGGASVGAVAVGLDGSLGLQEMSSRAYSDSDAGSGAEGFLETLTRWLDDEARDGEDDGGDIQGRTEGVSSSAKATGSDGLATRGIPSATATDASAGTREAGDDLPVQSSDPAIVHQQIKQIVARSGFVDLFALSGLSRLTSESLQILAKALVLLSRPGRWSTVVPPTSAGSPNITTAAIPADDTPSSPTAARSDGQRGEVIGAGWHDVADPVFGLELLTNMMCMSLGSSQCSISQIWPLVSTHFERLLQYVIAGGGGGERQFIERLIVNTLRLCIRLIGNAEIVSTLLSLLQQLSKLPPGLFSTYSERIACGLFVFVQEGNLPHSGLCAIFKLLKRTAEIQDNPGACVAGIECLNYWLRDDQELSRLLSMQQFPELLATLKAFASHSSPPASSTALDHLSNLVPQLARGARSLPQAPGQWQSLWVPTLHAISHVAREGSQKSSAQAFVYLQRLLLEKGTDLSLPWEELPFTAWKECFEQVLFPLLQSHLPPNGSSSSVAPDIACVRQANAAQLLCRVVLTHLPDWLLESPEAFPVLFLRLLHVLVSDAASSGSVHEPLVESLKNLLLVISADPVFGNLASPQLQGESLIEAAWGVVSPAFPSLRREIDLIFNPELEMPDSAPEDCQSSDVPQLGEKQDSL